MLLSRRGQDTSYGHGPKINAGAVQRELVKHILLSCAKAMQID